MNGPHRAHSLLQFGPSGKLFETHSATQGLAEALQRLFSGFQGLRLNAGSFEDGFVWKTVGVSHDFDDPETHVSFGES